MYTNGVSQHWLQTWRVKGVTCNRQYGAMEVEGRQWNGEQDIYCYEKRRYTMDESENDGSHGWMTADHTVVGILIAVCANIVTAV